MTIQNGEQADLAQPELIRVEKTTIKGDVMRKKLRLGLIVMFLLYGILTTGGMDCLAAENPSYCGDSSFVQEIRRERSKKTKAGKGKVYYLSTKGNDKGNGSRKKPFRTFAKALKKLKPGDTLYVRGGTYLEPVVIPKMCSGSKNSYITVCSYPGEQPVISGRGKKSPVLVTVDGASYVRIAGFELKDAKGQDACGISISPGSHHVILSGNSIQQIKVQNPRQKDHCANGILLFGDDSKKSIHDILIYGNHISDCETGWAECISVTGNCTNINVIENDIDKTGNIGIDFSGNYGYCSNPAKDFPRNCLIYKNKVANCVSKVATSYGIYVDGGQHITIQGNSVSKCGGGIEIGAEEKPPKEKYATSDITVTGNTLKNNLENAITVGGYTKKLGWVKDVQITDNTCRNNGKKNAILTLAKCDGVLLRNNVFCNDSGRGAVVYSEFSDAYTRNIVFEQNRYANGGSKNDTCFVYLGKKYRSFEKWKKAVGKKAGTYLE